MVVFPLDGYSLLSRGVKFAITASRVAHLYLVGIGPLWIYEIDFESNLVPD